MDYVYLWADGIHVNIRLEEHNLCLQVMIGVCADGRKELIAPRGWLPRVHEVVGGHAARLRPPWHARPGAGCRGRGAGVLEPELGQISVHVGGDGRDLDRMPCELRRTERLTCTFVIPDCILAVRATVGATH